MVQTSELLAHLTSLSCAKLTLVCDRVDHNLNCIKGGGACHLREKVLAEAAETWIVVADYRKNSEVLGTSVSISHALNALK